MADELKPFSKLQMLDLMIVENINEITKTEITEQMTQRERLRGTKTIPTPQGPISIDLVLGGIQAKVKVLQKSLADLQDLRITAVANESVSKV